MELGDETPAPFVPLPGADATAEELMATIAKQNGTIESLHVASAKLRNRLASAEQQLTIKQAENDAQRVLMTENATLRSEMHQLRDKLRELEQTNSRLVDANAAELENQAQLGVKVQAYQRHNTFLQGEISLREAKMKALQEQVDVLAEEAHTKDRRVTILVEKLRQHNIDLTTTTISKVTVPEASYAEMKEKLSSQNTTIDLLREKLEALQDDGVRRENVVEALQRENKALKGSISRLIRQISSSTTTTNGQPIMAATVEDDVAQLESKLHAYHARRAAEHS